MNVVVGWLLAGAALVAGYAGWGWQGLVLALTVIVFWLLLQFSRTMRVMRGAAESPVGMVPNALMFNAKLHAGMRLVEVIALTRSLGRRVSQAGAEPEVFAWHDERGDRVTLHFADAKLASWQLDRKDTA